MLRTTSATSDTKGLRIRYVYSLRLSNGYLEGPSIGYLEGLSVCLRIRTTSSRHAHHFCSTCARLLLGSYTHVHTLQERARPSTHTYLPGPTHKYQALHTHIPGMSGEGEVQHTL